MDKIKSKKSLTRSNEKKKQRNNFKKPIIVETLQKSKLKIGDKTRLYPKINTEEGSTMNSNFSNAVELGEIQEDLKSIHTHIKKISLD